MIRINCLRFQTIVLCILAVAFPLTGIAQATPNEPFSLIQVESHHYAKINSGQPFVGGFQVLADDFRTYMQIDGATITVAFPSTNASSFPSESWLGAGMFLQAQDHKYLFVDYGFYMMIVLDCTSNLFIDIGLHQTREGSLPVHQPDSELVYAHTWQLSGVEPATPITLVAQWDIEESLDYSVNIEENNFPITSIRVCDLLDCENIMPAFYSGNVIGQQFPLGRYVDFFQFGVTSSEKINSNQWNALLREPKYLKQGIWENVEKAWSIQGDISYLDQDARWGGTLYEGVAAQYPMNSLQNLYNIVFSYEGRSLPSGTVLWDMTNSSSSGTQILNSQGSCQIVVARLDGWLLLATVFFGALISISISICNRLDENRL